MLKMTDKKKKTRRKKKSQRTGRPPEDAGPEGKPHHHVGIDDIDPLAHGKEYRNDEGQPFDPHIASGKTDG